MTSTHKTVAAAIAFAASAHVNQFRAHGIPYFDHCYAVYSLVRERTTDYDLHVASLLHDVAEDTPVTLGQIQAVFGERVATLVSELTNDYSDHDLPEEKNKAAKRHAEHMSPEAKLIKLCDRHHNLSECWAWKPVRIMRYVANTRALLEGIGEAWSNESKKMIHEIEGQLLDLIETYRDKV